MKTPGRHAQDVGRRWERGGKRGVEGMDENIYLVAIGSQLGGRFLHNLNPTIPHATIANHPLSMRIEDESPSHGQLYVIYTT